MIKTDSQIIDDVIQTEGVIYTNRPDDKGGPTKFGITLETLSGYRKRPCTPKDVENLTRQEASDIYAKLYIADPGFNKIIDPALRYLVIDSGVLHGQGQAAMWLQAALGVKVDGGFGPKSQAALAAYSDQKSLFLKVLASRIRFDATIVTSDYNKAKASEKVTVPLQAANSQGWADRSCRFIDMVV